MTQPEDLTGDQDSVWKDILKDYIEEFIAFYFPDIHAKIDWTRPPEFLEKELIQLAFESEVGKRLVDKLVKVFAKDGTERWVVIHIEVQGRAVKDFAERMFIYSNRIYDLYRRPVVSLAVLTDGNRKFRPNSFKLNEWGSAHTFNFRRVKLLDFAKNWEDLEQNPNPFAIVTMAHLKVLELHKRKKADRDYVELAEWKFTLTKMLYKHGYSRQMITNLFRFIDWLIRLPKTLDNSFWDKVLKYEEELKVPYTLGIERIGIAKGRHSDALEFTHKLLEKKFGEIDPKVAEALEQLPAEKLQDLGVALLDFTDKSEVSSWLKKNRVRKSKVERF